MYSLPQAEGEKVDAILKDDTLWMTQKAMSKVFDVEVSSISRHITNIIATEELTEKSNLQKMQIAISDKPVTLYSLDMAIAVGYRVNSARATKFRKRYEREKKTYQRRVQSYPARETQQARGVGDCSL